MKFRELDQKMRIYETAHDHCVMPGVHIVVRLDGRGFTRLTKEKMDMDRPFDIRFRDAMIETTSHLMQCGFRVIYGYTQSDEISLLLARDDHAFERKERKINSVLAGEASAYFSLELGSIGAFDSRICQLPSDDLVVDYFRWRNEDAHRNALNAHCYWILRDEGATPEEAAARFHKMAVADKNEFLFRKGVNFNELPLWQKRGTGFWWESVEKEGIDPRTGEAVFTARNRLRVEMNLPMKDEYSTFIREFL